MKRISSEVEDADLGDFEHYMLKEIYEQPHALAATFAKATDGVRSRTAVSVPAPPRCLRRPDAVQIVACGTSYHAGLVARYWLEDIAGIPCQVEVASEYRYRRRVSRPGTLLVTVSQSGETADTLAALRHAAPDEFVASLVIANVDNIPGARE
jgi:glucosamine--fructose-6-phosphate aminotransferase (isomerizing)